MAAEPEPERRNITRPYELAAALRGIRREQNLTQAQLASQSGTSRQWVSAAENNKLPFGVELVCRLIYALGYQIHLVPAAEPSVDLEAHLSAMTGAGADVYDTAGGELQ